LSPEVKNDFREVLYLVSPQFSVVSPERASIPSVVAVLGEKKVADSRANERRRGRLNLSTKENEALTYGGSASPLGGWDCVGRQSITAGRHGRPVCFV